MMSEDGATDKETRIESFAMPHCDSHTESHGHCAKTVVGQN